MPEEVHYQSVHWSVLEYFEPPAGVGWYIFWFVVLLIGLIYAIFTRDFLFGVIVVLAGFFAFYIIFEEPKRLNCRLDHSYLHVNNKTYGLGEFRGFEIYRSHFSIHLYFFPKHFNSLSIALPINFEDIPKIREILRHSLPELRNQVSFLDELYHALWRG